MKNKKIIIFIILLVLVLIVLILGFIFKDNFISKKSDLTFDEIIINNYNKEFHSLNLSSKNLNNLPDLCKIVEKTNYVYDIWSIDLANNNIKEIDKDLSCFKNLSELNLSFNKISKIENLEWLTFLKKLDLGNNEIKEINNLDKLINLGDLHLWYNKITSTKWLEKLTNLTSLKLQHNEINDLSYLKDLTNLSELKLEFNKLSENNLKDIQNLKKLKIITVWENKYIRKETIEKLNAFSLKNMKADEAVEVKTK